MPNQEFFVCFKIKTECGEFVTSDEIKSWTEEMFHGCDMGEVEIMFSLPIVDEST